MMHKTMEWIRNILKGRGATERSNRAIFITIIVFALLSLLAAFVLSIEEFILLRNPDAQLSCNINAVLNCASVMKTKEAAVFGFPNSFLGLITEPVMITLAIGYLAGARYKQWFYVAANIGSGLGSLFAYWLFFESVYNIQILCPWCLLVTVSTTIIFEAITRYNLRENNFGFSKKTHKKVLDWLSKDYDKFIAAGWLVLLTALVLLKFSGIF
jgi:uncharacterized membrane protein